MAYLDRRTVALCLNQAVLYVASPATANVVVTVGDASQQRRRQQRGTMCGVPDRLRREHDPVSMLSG